MAPLSLTQHLDRIASAGSACDLEREFQAALRAFPSRFSSSRIDRAMRSRGRAICASSPHARFVPALVAGRQLMLCGQSYSVGYGQNSTGERYVWHDAEQWMGDRLTEADLSPEVVRDVLSWWRDFPHRALASIENGGWLTACAAWERADDDPEPAQEEGVA